MQQFDTELRAKIRNLLHGTEVTRIFRDDIREWEVLHGIIVYVMLFLSLAENVQKDIEGHVWYCVVIHFYRIWESCSSQLPRNHEGIWHMDVFIV